MMKMKKSKLQPTTLEYYDFIEMTKIVKDKLGFDTRNCGKHFHPNDKKPPYMDFWHWQLDNCFGVNVQNDSHNRLYVGMDQNEWGFSKKTEQWQLVIQKVWMDLFYEISNNGWINVYISW